jgi:hypothetical protein
MEINMRVIFKTAKLMEKEYTCGAMEKFTMVNGKMALKKAMVYGKVFLEILILENGRIAKPTVMECINGKMVTGMKESGKIVSNMDKEQIYLLMAIAIQVNTRTVSLKEMGNTNGRMEVYT